MHVFVYVSMALCIHACIHAYMQVHVYACKYMYVCLYVSIFCNSDERGIVQKCGSIFTYTHLQVRTHHGEGKVVSLDEK